MVEFFELGKKNRPLLYGSAAFKLLKQRKGISMGDFLRELSSGEDPAIISDITYCALRIGEKSWTLYQSHRPGRAMLSRGKPKRLELGRTRN